MKDIETIDDIQLLVNRFYEAVRADELLGPIFDDAIQSRWPEHLEKMYRFWQTVLLQEQTYFGSPFPPHVKLPVEAQHFDRWIQLFNTTTDRLFAGERATEAKWRARNMAELFNYKLAHIRNHRSN